jgi:opacity protein-like surface antigen
MKRGCYLGLSIVFSNMAFAGEMGPSSPLPDNQFFVGIGGNYNSASLEKQTLYGKGVNSAYTGPDLTSSGSAAGTSSPFSQTENLFSPEAQIGYLQYFKNDLNFWGAKVSYSYLNAHLSNDGMTIPQAGSNYRYNPPETTYFTGNYLVESVQTSINHELLLLAFIGHSFEHSKLYFGIGPSLFGMHSNINDLVGHADYVKPGENISGAPAYLSKSMWQWGGAAQLGITYSLSSSWFLDFNYTYAGTARNTIKYVSPFTNVIDNQNTVGTSYINPSQQIAVQSFGISINKAF